MLGLGLWQQPLAATGLELLSLGLGVGLWWRFTQPARGPLKRGLTLAIALGMLAFFTPMLPDPKSTPLFIGQALFAYLFFATAAYGNERPRKQEHTSH